MTTDPAENVAAVFFNNEIAKQCCYNGIDTNIFLYSALEDDFLTEG